MSTLFFNPPPLTLLPISTIFHQGYWFSEEFPWMYPSCLLIHSPQGTQEMLSKYKSLTKNLSEFFSWISGTHRIKPSCNSILSPMDLQARVYVPTVCIYVKCCPFSTAWLFQFGSLSLRGLLPTMRLCTYFPTPAIIFIFKSCKGHFHRRNVPPLVP